MEVPKGVDLAAAARVSSRVEFRDIRLNEISASNLARTIGPLTPEIDHQCVASKHEGDLLEITCSYQLRVKSGENEVAKAAFSYLVSYTLVGDEPVNENDLSNFAFANGTYHSWPFVRQLVYDLTSRMGYPPYNLPVFKFFPRKPKPVETPPQPVPAGEPTSTHGSQASQ